MTTNPTPIADGEVEVLRRVSAHDIERIIKSHVRIRIDYPSDMTRAEILGIDTAASLVQQHVLSSLAEDNAKLIAEAVAAEREACARVIEAGQRVRTSSGYMMMREATHEELRYAAAIRARSNLGGSNAA